MAAIREELEQIDGIRKSFVARFVRTGRKRGKYSGDTVLLTDVFHATRLPERLSFKVHRSHGMVTDHLWFNLTGQFQELNLSAGDWVLFDARVKEYRKGSVKRGIPVSRDYKLSHPYKISRVKLGGCKQKTQVPP